MHNAEGVLDTQGTYTPIYLRFLVSVQPLISWEASGSTSLSLSYFSINSTSTEHPQCMLSYMRWRDMKFRLDPCSPKAQSLIGPT